MTNETKTEDVPVSATVSPQSSCQPTNNTQKIILQWSNEDPNIPGGVLNRNLTLVFALNKTTTPPSYGVSKINAVYELRTYNKTVNETTPVNITVTHFISMTTFAMNPRQFIVPQNRSGLDFWSSPGWNVMDILQVLPLYECRCGVSGVRAAQLR